MPTQKFIAELAGVSIATVSRALADDPRITAPVRARIQAIAQQFHYRSNRLIQGMRTGKSAILGLVVPAIDQAFYDRILATILDAAYRQAYHVVIIQTRLDPALTKAALHALVEQRVDGILVIGEPITQQASLLELRSHDIALVSVDRLQNPELVDTIYSDEEQMAGLVVQYLVGLGHRHFAYVGASFDTHYSSRWNCVLRALQHRGLAGQCVSHLWEKRDSPAVLHAIVQRHPRPTAIIAFSDIIAAYLLQSATRAGLHIPGDLSIIGFGNLPVSQVTVPPLTTVEQDPARIGREAVALLLRRLGEESPDAQRPATTLGIPGTLLLRESCGTPRTL
jgi:DNA-binding LacI/PurR family transcriptional regulator